ncbi:hypothetical protein PARPLA_03190 [Rhodobacteraceae bacterium THAF1]|uniref:DUF1127 domain-containing protein n=1 Tax=Palleronia sp. THAF1 TaxID=2587842 RepID=UPI000F3BE98C|nr:hypothetical protein [Palleronia sp. THAF1]QFU08594.1 hypothetical protein FIU81_07905 [Palleronia sp. THAF1]VDC30685.1 hypothetical protein PARPLA_03190 [Rhodobacteraceae bacterium THAF1]
MASDAFTFPAHPNTNGTIPTIVRRKGVPWPISTLILWQERVRMRDQLRTSPPELLDDMGLDAQMVRLECSMPFWRA